MLGSGRPFIVELIDPGLSDILFKKMRSIEYDINNSSLVKVRDLQIISKNEVKNLKEGEKEKKKTYKALCITKQAPASEAIMKIENSEKLVLEQKTPIRVLHRRPLAIRKRTVENIKLTKVPKETQDFFMYELEVTTQAGTYVKEFVHGDFGRTNPNLSDLLGIEMDIVALDVLNIAIDWPPALNQ
jgi:tRNA pseudouridine synthase 10